MASKPIHRLNFVIDPAICPKTYESLEDIPKRQRGEYLRQALELYFSDKPGPVVEGEKNVAVNEVKVKGPPDVSLESIPSIIPKQPDKANGKIAEPTSDDYGSAYDPNAWAQTG